LNRGGLRIALIGGVMIALATLGFVLGRTLVQRNDAGRGQAEPTSPPEVSQRIREFRRVKVRDGKKVWELTAREAQYLEDKGQVVVKNPDVLFYVDGGDSVHVTGQEGRIFVQGNNLDRIELGGGIEVKMRDYLVRTEQAFYDHEHDTIVSPGRVEISSNALALDGQTMVVELRSQRVQILNRVTTIFYRDGSSGPSFDIGTLKPSAERPREQGNAHE
jgi:LPS export ABC transporter protein LptC